MNEIKALPEPVLYTTLNYEGPVPFMTRELYLLEAGSNILSTLLKDRSINHPIFFGTNDYEEFSETFSENFRMSKWRIQSFLIDEDKMLFQTRSRKEKEVRVRRTKKRGEVLTPIRIVNQMIDVLEEEWKDLSLNDYLSQTILELCCGEAPFLVQRYDSITGELFSVDKRRGILDRKLHRISKSTDNRKTWRDRAYRAVRSVYGYEYQGDSLFLGRENVLFDYLEHYFAKFHELPPINEINSVATIISWNMFQMDGTKNEVPYFDPHQQELFETAERPRLKPLVTLWKSKGHEPKKGEKIRYGDEEMKFDAVIGNPAYQETLEGSSDTPVYNDFMDEAYRVADKVLLITPARFLFNAGKTPKKWNLKMLSDPHFKVIEYFPKAEQVFPNNSIMGGIALHYRDSKANFGAIENFIIFKELRSILSKVRKKGENTLQESIYAPESFKFTQKVHDDNPEILKEEILSKGHYFDVVTNIFNKLDNIIFFETPLEKGHNSLRFLGLKKNKRTYRWINQNYVRPIENLFRYKVFLPKSNGSGAIGETIPTVLIGNPQIGFPGDAHTQSFISIGNLSSEYEARSLEKYLKTKFCRALLGTLKVTQDNKSKTWSNVPLQDFTENSDIDWTKSIHEIDEQLYTKYDLSDEEINFIETHLKEMI